jgi:hypothetical protein
LKSCYYYEVTQKDLARDLLVNLKNFGEFYIWREINLDVCQQGDNSVTLKNAENFDEISTSLQYFQNLMNNLTFDNF